MAWRRADVTKGKALYTYIANFSTSLLSSGWKEVKRGKMTFRLRSHRVYVAYLTLEITWRHRIGRMPYISPAISWPSRSHKFGLFVFSCSACHVLESRHSLVRRFFIYYINGQIILLAHKMLAGSSDMYPVSRRVLQTWCLAATKNIHMQWRRILLINKAPHEARMIDHHTLVNKSLGFGHWSGWPKAKQRSSREQEPSSFETKSLKESMYQGLPKSYSWK